MHTHTPFRRSADPRAHLICHWSSPCDVAGTAEAGELAGIVRRSSGPARARSPSSRARPCMQHTDVLIRRLILGHVLSHREVLPSSARQKNDKV